MKILDPTTDEDELGSYRHDFETRRDEVATYVFAIEDFVMYRRGRHLTDAPRLDPSTIRSIGVLVSEAQEGIWRRGYSLRVRTFPRMIPLGVTRLNSRRAVDVEGSLTHESFLRRGTR